MRILTVGNMYPPHHLGGYELMWRAAVGSLRGRGHGVRVLTTDYRAPAIDPSMPDENEVFRELRWYWRDHDFPRLGARARAGLERHNATVLSRQLEAFKPEAISWWAMGGMSLSLIEQARRAGVPGACVVVDDWLLYGPAVDAWTRMARRVGPLAPTLERLTGVPTRMDLDAAEWLFASEILRSRAESAGWRLRRARVSYPGIDHELFRDPRPSRDGWSWKLLYCGRIDERKGIDTAIETLGALPAGARLRVLGSGDEAELSRLRAMADERVSFENVPREELPAAYADADVTVFPVRWEEPFGLVPLESMAMGTPVVASGRGGSGEYLKDGENCLLFDVDRGPAALASVLRRLADEASLRRRLHERGLATAAEFTEERFHDAVEASLLDAVSRSSGGDVSRRRPPAGS